MKHPGEAIIIREDPSCVVNVGRVMVQAVLISCCRLLTGHPLMKEVSDGNPKGKAERTIQLGFWCLQKAHTMCGVIRYEASEASEYDMA